ncbi:hypothetical protein ABPG72_005247 [Tetrahymena utriculariae]
MSFPKKVVNKERQICEAPGNINLFQISYEFNSKTAHFSIMIIILILIAMKAENIYFSQFLIQFQNLQQELTVYEHTTEMQTSHMCQEEIEINNWLEDHNIQMADPLDLIHQYFHVKKKKISEKIAENKKSKGLTQGSLLLERRAKKNVNAPTFSFSENI